MAQSLFDTDALDKRVAKIDSLGYTERRFEIHHRLTEPRLSRFLYKYRDAKSEEQLEKLREILVGSTLWFPAPKDLNDPFEMTAFIEFPKGKARRELFLRLLKGQGISHKKREAIVSKYMKKPDGLFEDFIEDSWHEQINTVGVCSFAGDPRSILMWSHYADNHCGVCLQFERARDPAVLLYAVPIDYSQEYPVYRWGSSYSIKDLTKIMLSKHEGWRYEKESRIVEDQGARIAKAFDPGAITGLIFGCECSAEVKARVLDVLAEREKASLPPIRLWEAERDRKQFRIRIRALADRS